MAIACQHLRIASAVLFLQIGWRCAHDACQAAAQSFSYFTVLGYGGLAFSFAFAAAHTASSRWKGRPWLLDGPSSTRWLHSVFCASVTVFPFVVTVISAATIRGCVSPLHPSPQRSAGVNTTRRAARLPAPPLNFSPEYALLSPHFGQSSQKLTSFEPTAQAAAAIPTPTQVQSFFARRQNGPAARFNAVSGPAHTQAISEAAPVPPDHETLEALMDGALKRLARDASEIEYHKITPPGGDDVDTIDESMLKTIAQTI
ncbi:uncharacterized protein MYCFIDRAFT_83707 [Pseudocercospora fijiensis CIRAD86]|uniref:Uncharacterized protein n=1 Tax=Pseudocercospora fijiensis (strain CIRAD86) TaxID=383855 RepID=M3APA0_PSEFD|nr:uncharacterized protein MYCFIDRAFT_83707 [Pseudocercospora fijiensis CIRAD86]EME78953.1 hypothetical protein MYCFIDRAFT_83707 [Pseudocercospora fijiensis CIRAD86]